MKRSLPSGTSGQTASYLTEDVLALGYELHSLIRRASRRAFRFSGFADRVIRSIGCHDVIKHDTGA